MSRENNSHLNQKNRNISVITLVLFLLAFFLHSHHIINVHVEQNALIDYQDCHICQQGIDSPPAVIQFVAASSVPYVLVILPLVQKTKKITSYTLPQLRAPPFIIHFI
jgi:hypothetical protein